MCCLQVNDTPLDDAVERNNIDIVHFFIKECNQDISTLKQVCNCVALFLIVMLYSFFYNVFLKLYNYHGMYMLYKRNFLFLHTSS